MYIPRLSSIHAMLALVVAVGFAFTPVLAESGGGQPDARPGANGTGNTAVMRAPVMAGGVASLDLPDSSAQTVSLDIIKGRFADYSVGRITLTGSGIDFRNGTLDALKADITEGDFDNVPVEKLSLSAPGFSFDTRELLNNRTFILAQPVTAQVNLVISEEGLNRFLANPKTLGKIEKSIQKQTGGVKLVTFSNPSVKLQSGDRLRMNVNTLLAQGLNVPLEMLGKLGIQNGQLRVTDLKISSGGNDLQLPVDFASSFQDKLNEMIDFKRLGKNSLVIMADNMKLTGRSMTINGHATLTKLQFGG